MSLEVLWSICMPNVALDCSICRTWLCPSWLWEQREKGGVWELPGPCSWKQQRAMEERGEGGGIKSPPPALSRGGGGVDGGERGGWRRGVRGGLL